jgi:acyl carrier protein
MLNDVQAELLAFVRERTGVDAAFDAATDLIGTGVLDSLLLVDLVLHIDRVCGMALGAEDVTPDNFRNINSLARIVCQRSDVPSRKVA